MARKKATATRSQQSILDKQHLGAEPIYSIGHVLTRTQIMRAYNWYNYMCTRENGYKYLLEYFKNNDKKKYNLIKKTPEKNFPQTVYWIARIKNLGYVLPLQTNTFFIKSLDDAINKIDSEDAMNKPTKKVDNVISIQDRIKEKRSEVVGQLEEVLDEHDSEFSLYNHFLANDIAKIYCPYIVDYYKPVLQELNDVLGKKDKQLNEAYRIYTVKQVKTLRDIVSGFISDSERYSQNKKTVNKRKAKTSVSLDKKVKSFNFKKEDSDLKIVSIDPTMIIGAKEIWFYNSKYSAVTVMRSESINGFDIKGTSILNIDESKSEVKKVGNKAKKIVQEILNANKASMKKVLKSVNTKSNVPSQRTTKDMVILKVIK